MKVVEKKRVDETPEGTEGARRATGVFSGEDASGRPSVVTAPDSEVVAKAQRRRFTAQYKQKIVREADRCTKPGEIGAAFLAYNQRVILLVDKRLTLPSNLQGLYRCEYTGDELDSGAVTRLQKGLLQFRVPVD